MAHWRAYLDRKDWGDGARLMLVRDDGKPAAVKPFVFQAKPEGFVYDDEDFACAFYGDEHRDFLQAMTNLAWEHGVKPTGLAADESALKATQYHLEDFRKLVLKDRA